MHFPLKNALDQYLRPDLPTWGEAESEIDPPSWQVAPEGCDPTLPGGGLGRHTMLYIGEGNNPNDCARTIHIIVLAKIAWRCRPMGWLSDY